MNRVFFVRASVATALGMACLAGTAAAQDSLLFADRDANRLWRLTDVNGDGVYQYPAEVFMWFDGTNEAGTQGIENINTFAMRSSDGFVLGGDQVFSNVFAFIDLNGDGDAMDAGESWVAEAAPNASSINIAFPTGAFFDSEGRAFVVNAGNGFGADAIYELLDVDADGRYNSAGEILPFCTTGAFGATPNGPFSPQEALITEAGDGFLRNSGSLNGVYTFSDVNTNGRGDDAGEFKVWWNSATSGVTPSAGFALERDAARPGSLYTLQIATGGIDQLVRLTDVNGDGDANDAGEAVLAHVNNATGFSAIDIVSLPDGDVLMTDNSGKRIVRLHDANGDNVFSAAESSVVFESAGGITEVRALMIIPSPSPTPCPADFNQDGGVDGGDIEAFFSEWEAGNAAADVNRDGGVDGGDIEYFFQRWEAGGC